MSRLTLDRESLGNLARRFGAQAALAGGRLRVTVGGVDLALDRCDLGGDVRVGPVAIAVTGTRLVADAVEVEFSVISGGAIAPTGDQSKAV
ncbi:MAG: hypothetical protein H0W72_06385 [Planctomycetes bacterium]|nr:hypothetical protein [Planctomycetota bacterium]